MGNLTGVEGKEEITSESCKIFAMLIGSTPLLSKKNVTNIFWWFALLV